MPSWSTRRPAGALAAAVLGLAAAACGSGTQTSAPASGGSGATVTAQNFAFQPATVSVTPGAQVTITFVNKDSTPHTLTFDDNSQSVQADAGQTQTLTFTAPASGATISFHCKFHSSMHGTITTGGSAAGAGGASSSSAAGGYGAGY